MCNAWEKAEDLILTQKYNFEKCTAHCTVVNKKKRTNSKFFFHFSFSFFVHIHPTARNMEWKNFDSDMYICSRMPFQIVFIFPCCTNIPPIKDCSRPWCHCECDFTYECHIFYFVCIWTGSCFCFWICFLYSISFGCYFLWYDISSETRKTTLSDSRKWKQPIILMKPEYS